MKKILHIVHRYWPFIGGSEGYIQKISEGLVKDGGYSVSVYTTDAWDIELFWSRDKRRVSKAHEAHNGVQIHRFPVEHFPFHTKMMHFLSFFSLGFKKSQFQLPSPFVPELKKTLKRNNGEYDLVHATSLPYDSLIYLAYNYAKENKIPLLFTPFIHLGEGEKSGIARHYLRPHQMKMIKEASKVFVQTPTERDILIGRGIPEEKLELVGMGVSLADFQAVNGESLEKKYQLSKPIILHLGTQAYDKGSHHLIQAMKSFWERGGQASLVLAGPSTEVFRRYFENQPSEVQKNCLVLDFVSHQEKIDLLKAADLIVVPSRTDSFGLIYLEAWVFKKPVIGAWAGGVPDVIDHEVNGFLVEFGDIIKLRQYIGKLLEDRTLAEKLGRAGYQKVMDSYRWESKYSIIKAAYQELLYN